MRMIKTGKIVDAQTIAALTLAALEVGIVKPDTLKATTYLKQVH